VVDGLREGEVAIGEGIYELAITLGGAVGSAVLGAVLAANASKLPGTALPSGDAAGSGAGTPVSPAVHLGPVYLP
jgi:hypothetical protein